MNGGFGPDLGTSSSPLMGGGHSLSLGRLGVLGSRRSSRRSSNSERILPHPSYYRQPTTRPGPVGTIAPGESKWMIPLCHEPANDVNTCCLGCWCPCVLYGRTQYRLRRVDSRRDSLDLTNYNVCNGPCGTFMLAQYCTTFCWIFVMMQHSRIRKTYSIEGSTADDCLSAYFCPCCTLMQGDREIRARDYKDEKKEKAGRGITNQPSAQPDMQYGMPPSVVGGKPVQHRGSLLREEPTTAVTGQKQGPVDHGFNGENQNGLEHSQRCLEHKKVPKIHITLANEQKTKVNGEKTRINHQRRASSNGSTQHNPPTHPDQQERDAILAARQNWRHQNISGRPEGRPENAVADGRGDGDKGGENSHSVTTHHIVFDYSEDASLSQVRGKRVLKQISKIEGHPVPSAAADLSESPADDSVLVFYEDRDPPQRHSLADCARLRASTLDRTDTPHRNDLLTRWHDERTVAGHGLSQTSELHDLAACPKVIVTEDLKPLDQQHIFDDCGVECTNKTVDINQNLGSYSLDSFASDTGTAKKEPSEPDVCNPDPIEQHLLKDCATGSIVDVTDPMLVEGVSEYRLLNGAESDTETAPIESARPNQHGIAGSTSVGDAQPIQPPSLGQHAFIDHISDAIDAQSEASDGIHSTSDHPRSKLAAEQDENHTTTPPVPRHPVTPITPSEVPEEVTGHQPSQSRSKSADTVAVSNDLTTPLLENHGAGPSNPTSDHDGMLSRKDGQRQLSLASESLRKVLRASADTPAIFEENDPTEVNNADENAKRSASPRPRTKAVAGRVQKS